MPGLAQLVNSEQILYWLIRKRIREEISARKIAAQKKDLVDLLSRTLCAEYGRKFSRYNLLNMILMRETLKRIKQ